MWMAHKYLVNRYQILQKKNCMRTPIIRFFLEQGFIFLNEGNSISRKNYPNGYCLFAFDLTPDLSANDNTHWNLLKHGNVRIEVRFEEVLQNTINYIIYAEYDNILEIDASRQVIVDYDG